jgi:hypothetical protein
MRRCRAKILASLMGLAGPLLLAPNTWAQSSNLVKSATDMVRNAGSAECSLLEPERQADGFTPDIYTFQHKETYEDAAKTYRLIRVPCWLGAYNQGDMYVLVDPYDTLSLMSFAVPQYVVKYRDSDEPTHVRSARVTGYTSRLTVVMSEFHPDKLEITELNLSRGIGDASTRAAWRFKNGGFGLRWFDLDASYDGEINPKTLVNFGGSR